MPKYRIVIEDLQVYDFTIDIPGTLSPKERDDFIWNYLAEHRDQCWSCGEEGVVAIDEVPQC